MKKILSIILIVLLSLTFTQTINAEETKKDTTLEVHVITDENLTAYINGSAGGDVDYYIDGIEVSAEFMALWSKINKLDNEIKDVEGTANLAWGYADNAYGFCSDNNHKIYLIRDELIAFEGDYLGFKNHTNNTLGMHAEGLNQHARLINENGQLVDKHGNLIDQHAGVINAQGNQLNNQNNTLNMQGSMINNLQDTNLGLQKTVRAQSDQIEEMNSLLGLIKNVLIILAVIAALVVLFYLLNRKYPFGKIAGKAKKSIKNIRKPQPDYVKSSKKAQSKKTLMYKIKHTHIRRNPERSPVKLLISFLHIQ